jgi:phosphopantetheinyl transferase
MTLRTISKAAQAIGKCMGIGGTAELSNIQVLIIQLDVEQRVRTEGRADPLWSVNL